MKDRKFIIIHIKLVMEGCFASLYGMVWAMWMRGVGVMRVFNVLPFARLSAMSLPLILVWAWIF